MIKTIRNSNTNRVVGILVNGKRYSLGKDLCHALNIEEELMLKQSKKLQKDTLSIKNNLEEQEFIGSGESLKVKLKFKSNNTINVGETVVEFLENISTEEKDYMMEILEDFVNAINEAQCKRSKLLTAKFKNTTLNLDESA
jgi:DNA-binding protein YbaB